MAVPDTCAFDLWSPNGTKGRMGGRYEVSSTARLDIDTSTNFGVMARLPSEDGASTWLTIL
jgi:hypothetical protein